MPRYHTVVPLLGVTVGEHDRYEFGAGLTLERTPDWVRRDGELEQRMSARHREFAAESTSALVVVYNAAALGEPDPAWDGPQPKSIQESKYELCVLGNLALWLARPSGARFEVVFHGPELDGADGPLAQQIQTNTGLLCHPNDVDNELLPDDLMAAAAIHRNLATVARNTGIWTATRAAWFALGTNQEPVRYALFWMALEALYGPDDGREMTFRLAQRVGLFLGTTSAEAKAIFALVKRGYAFRSRIVHGRWALERGSLDRMAEAEDLLRRSLVTIVSSEEHRQVFSGGGREPFLDELAFK